MSWEAGTTTRNIRAYQTKGVLEPPDIVGRIGYYGDDHLTRLKLISRLQQRGFGLAAISDLLDAWDSGASLSEVLGFQDALLAPWSDEAPEKVSRQQLETLFPDIQPGPYRKGREARSARGRQRWLLSAEPPAGQGGRQAGEHRSPA